MLNPDSDEEEEESQSEEANSLLPNQNIPQGPKL